MIVPFGQMDNGVRYGTRINSVNYMYTNNSGCVNVMRGQTWRVDFTIYRDNTETPNGSGPAGLGWVMCELLSSNSYCHRGIMLNRDTFKLGVTGATSSGYGYLYASSDFVISPYKVYECTIMRSGANITFIVNGVTQVVSNAYGTNDMTGDCTEMYVGKNWWNGVYYNAAWTYTTWNWAFNKTALTKGTVIPCSEGTGTTCYNTASTAIFSLQNGDSAIWKKYLVKTSQK